MSAIAVRPFESSATSSSTEAGAPKPRPLAVAAVAIAMFGSMTAPIGQPIRRSSTVGWTQSSVPGALGSAQVARHARHELLEMKQRSGLTWQQIAESLGVDRRALHHWINGGGISVENELRLRALSDFVRQIDVGAPADVRAALMDSRDGPSALQLLEAGADPRDLSVAALQTEAPRPAYADALVALQAGRLRPLPRRRIRPNLEPVSEITLDMANEIGGLENVERARSSFRPRPSDRQVE